MKQLFLLLFLILLAGYSTLAQNSVGINTSTPNQKAVLELVSPNNNQGFLVPRLTTTQRTAMTLATTDRGLMVYDTNFNQFWHWDGSNWKAGLGVLGETAASGDLNGTFPEVYINNDAVGADELTDVAGNVGTFGAANDSTILEVTVDVDGRVTGVTGKSVRVGTSNIYDASILNQDIANTTITISKLDPEGNSDQVLVIDAAGTVSWVDRSEFTSSDLATNNIYVGDAAGVAAGMPVDGDVTISNDGTQADITINAGAVTADKINADVAGEGLSKNTATEALDINAGNGLRVNADALEIAIEEIDGDGIVADLTNEELDINVDDATLETAADVLQIKDAGVTNAKIANFTILAEAKLSPANPITGVDYQNRVMTINEASEVTWQSIGLNRVFATNPSGEIYGKPLTDFATNSLNAGSIFIGDNSNNAIQLFASGTNQILIGNGTGLTSATLFGDATITSASGEIRILDNAVQGNDIDATTQALNIAGDEVISITTSNSSAQAIQLDATAGSIDIGGSQGVLIDATSNNININAIAGRLNLTSNQGVLLDADNNDIDIDAISGSVNIDANQNITLTSNNVALNPANNADITTTSGVISLNSGDAVDISGDNTSSFTTSAGDIDINAAGQLDLDGGTTVAVDGATGVAISSTANNVNITGANSVVATATAGQVDINADNGNVTIDAAGAGSDVVMTAADQISLNAGNTQVSSGTFQLNTGEQVTDITDVLDATGDDATLPTEKAVRDALNASITADNGLNESTDGNIQLGGDLTIANTTITQGAGEALTISNTGDANTTISLSGTGDLVVDGQAGDVTIDDQGLLTLENGLTVAGGTVDLGANAVQSGEITDGTISVDDIGTGAVGSDEIIDNSIDAIDINTDAVTTDEIDDGTIATIDIADDAVTTDKLGTAGASDGNKIYITDAAGNPTFADISTFTTTILAEGSIYVGDVSGNASEVDASGDGNILIGDGTTLNSVGVTGDVTIDNAGDIQIKTDAVGSNEIIADAVGSDEIATDAVGSSEIATDAVGFLEIASDAVGSDEIASGAVDSDEIAGGAVITSKILDNNVTLDKIVDGTADQILATDGSGNPVYIDQSSIVVGTASDLVASGSVVADSEVDNNLTISGGLIDNTVIGGSTAAAGTFTTLNATVSTTTDDLTATGTVDLGTDQIESVEITDGTIATIDIANDAITAAKINADVAGTGLQQNGTTGALEADFGGLANTLAGAGLADDGSDGSLDVQVDGATIEIATNTLQVVDGGIDTDQLADDAVTTAKIEDGAVVTGSIQDNTILTDDIRDGTIQSIDIENGTIQGIDIADNNITLAKIADGGPNQILTTDGSGNPVYIDQTAIVVGTASDLVASSSVVSDSEVDNDLTINGGTIDNTPIGGSGRSSGNFTNLDASGSLNIDGLTTLNGNVEIGDGAGDIIDITGATNLNGGSVTIASDLTLASGATVSNIVTTIGVTGSDNNLPTEAAVRSAITSNALTNGEGTTANGTSVNIGGGNAFTGSRVIDVDANTLTIDATAGGSFVVDGVVGDVSVDQNGLLTAGNGLTVSGTVTLDNNEIGDAEVVDALTINGGTVNNTVIGGSSAAAGSFTNLGASGTLNADGATTLGNTLGVTGATTLSSTLDVTGTTSLAGDLTLDGGTVNVNNIVTTIGVTGSDNNLATEQAIREAISAEDLTDGEGTSAGLDGTSVNIGGGNAFTGSRVIDVDASDLTIDATGGGNFIVDGTTGDVTIDAAGLITSGNGITVTSGDVDITDDLLVGTNADVSGTFNADGATTLGNTLGVTGATTLSSTLDVTGNTDVSGTFNADGVTTLGNTLDVTGATTLSSTLDVTGNTDVSGTLNADGATTLGNTLGVTGATTLSSTLDVTGTTSLAGDLTLDGGTVNVNNIVTTIGVTGSDNNLATEQAIREAISAEDLTDGEGTSAGLDGTSVNIGGGNAFTGSRVIDVDASDLTIDATGGGNFIVDGTTGDVTIDAAGLITSGNGITVTSGDVDITDDLLVGTNADVSGTFNADGVTTLGNTLDVTAATTLNSTLDVTGNTDVSGTFNADGVATLGNTLDVTGATTLSSTLDVTGNTDVSGTFNADGATTLGNTLGVTGATTLSSTLDVTGTTSLAGDLTLDGGTVNVNNIVTTIGVTGSDNNLATEQAIREAIAAEDLTNGEGTTVGADGTSVDIGGGNAFTGSRVIDVDASDLTIDATGGGNFIVDGTTGDVTIDAAGLITSGNGITVTSGDVDITDDLLVGTNADVSGTFNADGATTLGNTLGVTGATTLSSTLDVTGTTSLAGDLTLDGGTVNVNNIVTTIGVTGSDNNLATEQAIREAIAAEDLTNGEGTTVGADGTSVDIGGGNAFTGSRVIDVDASDLTIDATGGGNFIVDGTTGDVTIDAAGLITSGNGITVTSGDVDITDDLLVGTNADVSGTFNADGVATLGNTLDVTGATTLSSTLDVTGNTDVSGTFNADGVATLGNTLDVTGATTLSSTLDVTGNTDVSGTLNADGATTLGNTLGVTGATTLSSTLDVTGTTSLAGDLTLDGGTVNVNNIVTTIGVTGSDNNLATEQAIREAISAEDLTDGEGTSAGLDGTSVNIGGGNAFTGSRVIDVDASDLTIDATGGGNFIVDGTTGDVTIDAAGLITSGNGITVTSGDVDITDDLLVGTNADVSGTFNADGATTLGNTLGVTGATTLSSTLDVTGNTDVSGTFNADGVTTLGNTLDVTGATTLSSTLDVTGNTDVSGTFNADGATTLGNTLGVTGATTLSSTLDVTGTTSLAGDLTLDGGTVNVNNIVTTIGVTGSDNNLATEQAIREAISAEDLTDGEGTSAGLDGTSVNIGGGNAFTGSRVIDVDASDLTIDATGGGNFIVDGTTGDVTIDAAGLITSGNGITVTSGDVDITDDLLVGTNADVSGTFNADGATTLGNTLGVTGATTLSSTLDVTGNTDVSGTLNADGATTLGNTLGVTGATTLSSTLDVTGTTSLAGDLTLDGGTVNVNNIVTTIGVTGSDNNLATEQAIREAISAEDLTDGEGTSAGLDGTSVNIGGGNAFTGSRVIDVDASDLTIDATGGGNFIVDGTAGDVTIDAAGLITSGNGITVTSGDVDITDDLLVGTNADVSGTFNADGATTLGNTLGVTGATTLSSTLNVTGNTDVSGTFNADGVTTLGNTLDVTGATTLSSTLDVTGNTDVSGTFNADGATTLGNTLSVTGATTLSSTLDVTGNTSLSTISTSGAATLNSAGVTNNLTVGGVTQLDGTNGLQFGAGTNVTDISTATDLGGGSASDANLSTQLAVKTYVDNQVGSQDLQEAYVDGNTITTSLAEGDVTITGTEQLVVSTTNGIDVTNNALIGGTLGVTGNTSLTTVSTSGTATLDNAAITNNATVGGTLDVSGATTTAGITNTGNIGTGTLSTSGTATLDNATITNNATVGGTLGVTGNTSLSTVSTSGAAMLSSAGVTNNLTVGGVTQLDGTNGLQFGAGTNVTGISTATDLGGGSASDANLSTQLAMKTYVDNQVGSQDLQEAYVDGNTITTSLAEGDVTITGTEQLVVSTTNGIDVTNNALIGGTLGVTGNTSLTTVSTSGTATLDNAAITNNATVGGTLDVSGATTTAGITNTGNIGTGTLSTSGTATLDNATITNNATVGGTLGVTGNTSLSTVSTSGAATLSSAGVTNNLTVGGVTQLDGTNGLQFGAGTNVTDISTATDLGGGSASDANLSTQLAVKTYVDNSVGAISVSLQDAYDGGQTIATDGSGPLSVTGTNSISLVSSNDVAGAISLESNTGTSGTVAVTNVAGTGTGAILLDAQAGGVDINGSTGITIDASINNDITLTTSGTGRVIVPLADINGGAIDNTVIGGTVAAAGTFTNLAGTQTDGGNLRLAGNVLSSTNTDGNITFTPAGSGTVISSSLLQANNGISVANGINVTSGNISLAGSATVDGEDVSALGTEVDDLVSLSGVSVNSTNLGTFTGDIISNANTISGALQELETDLDAVQTLTGVADADLDLGIFSGSTITDDNSIKGALQELESAFESGGGVIASSVDFTPAGNIVANNVQAAIEELDNEKLALTGGTISGNLTLGDVRDGTDIITVNGTMNVVDNWFRIEDDGVPATQVGFLLGNLSATTHEYRFPEVGFIDTLTVASNITLQRAYYYDNSISTESSVGDFIVEGTQGMSVTTANGLNISNTLTVNTDALKAYSDGKVTVGYTAFPTTINDLGTAIRLMGGGQGAWDGGGSPHWVNDGIINAGTPSYDLIDTEFAVNGGGAFNGDLAVAGMLYIDEFSITSDGRLKTKVNTISGTLESLRSLRGVTYTWREGTRQAEKDSLLQYGVIAQEIEEVYPELVTTHDSGLKTVNYVGLIPILLEAIKEQQQLIESLKVALDDEKTSKEDLREALNKQQKLMEMQTQAMLSVQQENNNIKSDLDQIKALLGIKADPVNSKSVGGK